jgi:hypothetical protein
VGVPIGLTFDAGDPERLGTFWCLALGYIEHPPPDGYESWAQYDAANGTPGNEAGYTIVDPDGKGPSIFFQPVPESKTAKNRLHMDVRVSGTGTDDERRARIESAVAPPGRSRRHHAEPLQRRRRLLHRDAGPRRQRILPGVASASAGA